MRLFFLLLIFPSLAFAHETHDPEHAQAVLIPAAAERNLVEITEDERYRYIKSNGIPDHTTGTFPNRSNPNAISAQNHDYRVSLKPRSTRRATPQNGVVGVALNGIPIEPGTAECYGQARGSRPNPNCEWREEAIVNGTGKLGLDSSNAHVQPTGAYHYHGIPSGLLGALPKGDIVHVGYAADGFKLLVSRSGAYKPSYRLKSGVRLGAGPGGRYDGTYTADYAYAAAKVGDLDECNGGYVDELRAYAYFLTEGFPFAPRCLMGSVDSSFARRGPSAGGQSGNDGRRPAILRRRPPPPHLR